MKLLHLSDLHLGKRLNEFSLLEDQAYILERILTVAAEERPDAVLIAGDVYDKPVPPAEAVGLFDDFLCRLSPLVPHVFIISGNHDSPERVAFGGRLMDRSGIHLSPVYGGTVEPIVLEDPYGPVSFHLLPFLKPAHVRRFWGEEGEIATYTDALAAAVAHMDLSRSSRNVLVTHQFVTGASRSESEELSVGGSDNVDAAVFAPFDYVALGHLHSPQNVGSAVRYCGTPLKYSFSEAGQQKSVTVAELGEKGSLTLRTVPLVPLRDLRELRGTYLEVTARDFYEGTCREDYLHITLTDEEDIPDAVRRLRVLYPNLMKLDYDNRRTRAAGLTEEAGDWEHKSPLELFEEFYRAQNGQDMSEEQRSFSKTLMQAIWEGEI